jgi:hypothetical protein
MIMAKELAILKEEKELVEMAAFVRRAVREGMSIHDVEGGLWSRLLALGHSMLEGYVEAQGTGDLGPTIEHEGRTLRRLDELHDRRYVSIFGELNIRRCVYGTRETQKHEVVPLDARLDLPDSEFSYILQDWDQELCVQNPYKEARRTVQKILGLGQSVRSLEYMNLAMSRQVESFRQVQAGPPAREEGEIMVLTADCTGVPMRKEELPAGQPPKPAVAGEEAERIRRGMRMACVGSAYTIAPFVRRAAEVVDEVMRKEAADRRPEPKHKQVRAELTRPIDGQEVNGKDRTFAWLQRQVEIRNPKRGEPGRRDKPLVCVMDGERALWKRLTQYLPGIICILDLYHVLQWLWKAAHCFHAEGSKEARAFVSQRLEKILLGQVGYVIGGLKQMGYKQRLKGAKLKQLEAAIGYVERNRRFMHYDEYLAAGYPIGSGMAEGACGHVVKDRMGRTGMRWRVPSAQAMLELRAIHASEQWDAFERYRIGAESSRLYPYKHAVDSSWSIAA